MAAQGLFDKKDRKNIWLRRGYLIKKTERTYGCAGIFDKKDRKDIRLRGDYLTKRQKGHMATRGVFDKKAHPTFGVIY